MFESSIPINRLGISPWLYKLYSVREKSEDVWADVIYTFRTDAALPLKNESGYQVATAMLAAGRVQVVSTFDGVPGVFLQYRTGVMWGGNTFFRHISIEGDSLVTKKSGDIFVDADALNAMGLFNETDLEMDDIIRQEHTHTVTQTHVSSAEWTIEELGAKIEAAGTFWNDWWWGRGRFAPEHIAVLHGKLGRLRIAQRICRFC